jgi:hypothetical protein
MNVRDMRDAAVTAHDCQDHVDDTYHCVRCGEKVLRGPASYVVGTSDGQPAADPGAEARRFVALLMPDILDLHAEGMSFEDPKIVELAMNRQRVRTDRILSSLYYGGGTDSSRTWAAGAIRYMSTKTYERMRSGR